MSNPYKNKSRIGDSEFREIIKYIREAMARHCEMKSPFIGGEIEIDESYFGARRTRGIRGRGARGKTIVFGLIKRGGEVYSQVVKSCIDALALDSVNKLLMQLI